MASVASQYALSSVASSIGGLPDSFTSYIISTVRFVQPFRFAWAEKWMLDLAHVGCFFVSKRIEQSPEIKAKIDEAVQQIRARPDVMHDDAVR